MGIEDSITLGEVLGEGASAVTYRATDAKDRTVCVKQFKSSLQLEDRDRIRREMEVLKGAARTLENVEYLMIELNGNSERYGSSKKDIKEHLKSLGFKILIKSWPDIVYTKA